jgi:hypothetical protein
MRLKRYRYPIFTPSVKYDMFSTTSERYLIVIAVRFDTIAVRFRTQDFLNLEESIGLIHKKTVFLSGMIVSSTSKTKSF